jgi:hypothetical protein
MNEPLTRQVWVMAIGTIAFEVLIGLGAIMLLTP